MCMLGNASNNIVKAYALYVGLNIVKERNISKIAAFWDSMMIVHAIVKRNPTGNNQLKGIIHHILSLEDRFVEFKIFHIKRDLNPLDNSWAKVGSRLEQGTIDINGERRVFLIP